jgi:hypothetical protein
MKWGNAMKMMITLAAYLIVYFALLWWSPKENVRIGEPPCSCLEGDPCQCDDCWCGPTLDQAWKQSVKNGSPVLIYVRQRPFARSKCISCRNDAIPNQGFPCTVLGVPDGKGNLLEAGRRDGTPPEEWIEATLKQFKKNNKKPCCDGCCQ